MSEINEPKKETVRIKLPSSQASSVSGSNKEHCDTVRINLPSRAPNNLSGSSPNLKPPGSPTPVGTRATVLPGLGQAPPAPSFPVPSIAEPVPSPTHTPSIAESIVDPPLVPPAPALVPKIAPPPAISPPGPKKETARIAIVPEPRSARPTIKMSKTQPLITSPEPSRETAPIFIEPANAAGTSEKPLGPLCWTLLGVSALIFIIQVWTYFS